MKSVKVMLSGILVLALVAGAFAFKVRVTGVCAYSTIDAAKPATTDATLTHAATTSVTIQTANGADTEYATTIVKGLGNCAATAVAPQFKTLAAE